MSASVGEVRAYLQATAQTVLAAHWRETLGREVTSIEDIEQAPNAEESNAKVLQHRALRLAAQVSEKDE